MIRKCNGCGYTLQCDKKEALGYVPKEKINDAIYCERCYKIIHYHDSLVVGSPIETEKIITKVNTSKSRVFFIVELLNIHEESMHLFHEITCPKVLVISKCDIIPRSIKQESIIAWIRKEYHIKEEIIFTSGLKKYNVQGILKNMETYKSKESYFLGYTNSGKSTLLNAIYERLLNEKSLITTSLIPNTTLDFIRAEITPECTIIDSPGFLPKKSFYEEDEIDLIERIHSKNFLKPVTYQTKPNMSVIIEGRIRINCPSEVKNSMTFYMSNELEKKKVFENNEELLHLPEKKIHVLDDYDVVIRGIGFIHIKKECDLILHTSYLSLIEIRKSLF